MILLCGILVPQPSDKSSTQRVMMAAQRGLRIAPVRCVIEPYWVLLQADRLPLIAWPDMCMQKGVLVPKDLYVDAVQAFDTGRPTAPAKQGN